MTKQPPYVGIITDSSATLAFSNASLTRRLQTMVILMGILMGMVTMITCPPSARRSLPRTKALKSSHYLQTRLRQSVHLLETELDAVLALAPLRSPHSSAIPCKPVQLSSQPHNLSLLPRHQASLHLLTDARLRLPSAAKTALILDTTRFTLPLEIWMTSRRSIVVLLLPMRGEAPYHPTSVPMDMHTTMITAMIQAMNPSCMPTPWI